MFDGDVFNANLSHGCRDVLGVVLIGSLLATALFHLAVTRLVLAPVSMMKTEVPFLALKSLGVRFSKLRLLVAPLELALEGTLLWSARR